MDTNTSEETPDEHFKKTKRLLNELHNSGISISEFETAENEYTTPKGKITEKQNKINEKIIELAIHLDKKLNEKDKIIPDENNEPKTYIFKKKSAESLLNKIYTTIPTIYKEKKFFRNIK